MPDWREAAADVGFGLGWKAVNRMPERAAYSTFQRLADRTWFKHGAGVQQLERNLRRVRPELGYDELRELSRAGMRSYFRYWCDAFRLPSWSRERILGTHRTEGEEHLIARVKISAGYGAALRQAHAGSSSPFVDIEIDIRAISEDALVAQICAAGMGVQAVEPVSIRERVIAALRAVSLHHADAV